MNAARSLLAEMRSRPRPTAMAVGSIAAGVAALVLGAEASKAFVIIGGAGGGPLIARAMGGLLAAGGIATLVGVVRRRAVAESAGIALMAVGALIYGGGVLIGLHRGGLVAGFLALAYAAGCAWRVLDPAEATRGRRGA